MSRLIGNSSRIAFFCCDLQEKFAARIPNFSQCVFVANRFAHVHKALPQQTRYIVTEQYPQGLGRTVPDITLPEGCVAIPKKTFSMMVPDVVSQVSDIDTVVLFGIETHVCVLQTAADLLDMGKKVVIVRDGIGSQHLNDETAAVDLFRSWGPQCYVTTSESVLFQIMRSADHPKFKEISKLAQTRFVSAEPSREGL